MAEKVDVDGLTCPRCGGPAADLRECGFKASALAYEHVCYFWGNVGAESFTCNASKDDHG